MWYYNILYEYFTYVNTFFIISTKKIIVYRDILLYYGHKEVETVPEEEMRALIIKLQEEKKALEDEKKTLTETNTKNTTRITELQEHNQKLFLKITTPEKKKEEEEPEKSIEEIALELKI